MTANPPTVDQSRDLSSDSAGAIGIATSGAEPTDEHRQPSKAMLSSIGAGG
jgi:hypothetical protein